MKSSFKVAHMPPDLVNLQRETRPVLAGRPWTRLHGNRVESRWDSGLGCLSDVLLFWAGGCGECIISLPQTGIRYCFCLEKHFRFLKEKASKIVMVVPMCEGCWEIAGGAGKRPAQALYSKDAPRPVEEKDNTLPPTPSKRDRHHHF